MIKILAISHAYVELYTPVGLLDPQRYQDIDLTIIIPKFMAKKSSRL